MKQEIDEVKFFKILEGMPTYLVDRFWWIHFTKYVLGEKDKPPGPISNFALLNILYDYEFNSKTDEPDEYRDRVLFPLS